MIPGKWEIKVINGILYEDTNVTPQAPYRHFYFTMPQESNLPPPPDFTAFFPAIFKILARSVQKLILRLWARARAKSIGRMGDDLLGIHNYHKLDR